MSKVVVAGIWTLLWELILFVNIGMWLDSMQDGNTTMYRLFTTALLSISLHEFTKCARVLRRELRLR